MVKAHRRVIATTSEPTARREAFSQLACNGFGEPTTITPSVHCFSRADLPKSGAMDEREVAAAEVYEGRKMDTSEWSRLPGNRW
jgi:hypothetical protein